MMKCKEALEATAGSFDEAVGYAPNQAFVGAMHPRAMGLRPQQRIVLAQSVGFGSLVPVDQNWRVVWVGQKVFQGLRRTALPLAQQR